MNLPDVSFVEVSSAEIEKELFTAYEQICQRKLYPGNPERLFLETVAYMLGRQRFLIDYSAKQNMLYYAKDEKLDHLGALLDVGRLGQEAASVSLKFFIDQALDFDLIIPAGTRVTPDSDIMFLTKYDSVIAAGSTEVNTTAVCETSGSGGNGFAAGQIDKIVDSFPYSLNVINTAVSLGGADIESDEHYRERIRLAPEKFSNAGSKGAYRFHAMSAHQDIADVSVTSPGAGEVNVYLLLKNGELPGSSLISTVEAYLSSEKIRPLTDHVNVYAPEVVNYYINLSWFVDPAWSSVLTSVTEAVSKVVSEYVVWQKSEIGRPVLPDELISRLKNIEGVFRVDLVSPVFTQITDSQVAFCGDVNVSYGGIGDV
jgi:phage-related baseplate assembly protein